MDTILFLVAMTRRKTKIVCTVGPTSWNEKVLKAMIRAGMTVVRVNGAFADVAELNRVEQLARNIDDNIALMLDIKGHEVRLNKFQEAIKVKKGQIIEIGNSSTDEIFPVTYPTLWKDLKVGQKIMVDKGITALEIIEITNAGKIRAKVIFGEIIAPGKGMNFPNAMLSNDALTEIDKEQIKYCAKNSWEYVSASFIRNTEDIETVRKQIGNYNMRLIAKIEDQQGVNNIDEIIEASDGIMIARGDLGSELPLEKLPMIQKIIIRKCNSMAKPVILATNLLESMTSNIFPTRAEVTDVANGVLEGADALMTSSETAQGKHPVESVAMLNKIALETEQYLVPEFTGQNFFKDPEYSLFPAQAIYKTLTQQQVDKVLVISENGNISRILSSYNFSQPIFSFVHEKVFRNQLCLTKNVTGIIYKNSAKRNSVIIKNLIEFAYNNKLVKKNERLLITGQVKETDDPSPFIFELLKVRDILNN